MHICGISFTLLTTCSGKTTWTYSFVCRNKHKVIGFLGWQRNPTEGSHFYGKKFALVKVDIKCQGDLQFYAGKRTLVWVMFWAIDHFTVVCSVTWSLNGSEARDDLVLIQTSLLLLCKSSRFKAIKVYLHDKRREVCIKARSRLASLSFKGQVS